MAWLVKESREPWRLARCEPPVVCYMPLRILPSPGRREASGVILSRSGATMRGGRGAFAVRRSHVGLQPSAARSGSEALLRFSGASVHSSDLADVSLPAEHEPVYGHRPWPNRSNRYPRRGHRYVWAERPGTRPAYEEAASCHASDHAHDTHYLRSRCETIRNGDDAHPEATT